MPKVDQSDTNRYSIQQSEGEQTGVLDRLGGLLAFSGVQDTYQPGEQVSVEITADAKTSYDTDNAVKVVEIYKCADSSCDTSPPIDSSSEDQCSSEEWAPDYDDCIAKNSDSIDFSFNVDSGEGWNWDTSFSGLSDESEYVLVGYVWTSDQGIVTDVSKEQFQVDSASSGSESPELQPGVPEINYDGDQVRAEINMQNLGGDMPDSDIIEMQVRDENEGLLSFVNRQELCDSDYPENVHREYRIDGGGSENIVLTVDDQHLDPGTKSVYLVTAEECGGEWVKPYDYEAEFGTVDIPEDSTVKIEQASSNQEAFVTEDEIVSEISLVNTGGDDMSESNIIEMQVRPRGSGLLSLSGSSPQDTCDASHPENVHREFQLDSGQTEDIRLSVDKGLVEDGQYDVWLVTRSECGGGPVSPHGTGVIADTITVQEDCKDCEDDLTPIVPVIIVALGLGLAGVVINRRL